MPGVLFIRHDHRNPPGLLAGHFGQLGWDVTSFAVVPEARYDTPGVHVRFPDPLAFDAIVALGSDWSVSDPAISGWVDRELALLRAAHFAGVPVLGVCFGAQALAKALGGAVGKAPAPEIGWYEIQLADPLIGPGPWFEWHGDRFFPPPGSLVLGWTDAGPQAFRAGRSLGVQFHPEADEALVRSWLDHGREEITRLGLDPGDLIGQTRQHEDQAAARAGRLVDSFTKQHRLVRRYATYGG
jgi:GMP synthase-like glutamine amidotransferase